MASSTMIRSVQMQNIELLPAEVIKAFAEGAERKHCWGLAYIVLPKPPCSKRSSYLAPLNADRIVRGDIETRLSIDRNPTPRRRLNHY